MKVKVVANELIDTDIEMVSLVRHGANRCPFKVLKSEDDTPTSKLGEKLQSFFSLGKGEVAVTAYFIRKDATEALLPVLKSAGVDVTNVTEADGVTVVRVADDAAKAFLQLGDALAVAINQPLREFSDESIVKAYAEGVGLSGFAPSVNMAVTGLADAVWSLLNSGEAEGAREDRVAKVDAMLASFRKYITSLAKMLPEQVFKVEAAVRAAHTEESDMAKGKLDEAVAGDLDGLLKTDEAKGTPATDTQTNDDPGKVAKDEAALPPLITAPGAGAQPDKLEVILAKLATLDDLAAKVESLTKTVEEQRATNDSLVAQLAETKDELTKTEERLRNTTLVDQQGDMDLALSSLGGREPLRGRRPVAKTGEALWDGLMPDLENFRPSR